jgi:hypothetical protein
MLHLLTRRVRDAGRIGPTAWLVLGLGVTGSLAPGAALAAKQANPVPSVPRGFTITKLANAPKGATNCDDLARLDGHLFMTCQNKTQSGGGGGSSTIVEYADDGTVVNTWSLKDKADGIAGDPLHHRVIVTLNEDATSHMATITPSAPAGRQVTDYSYSVNPANPAGTGPLHTGGGTDSVSVDASGHVYISASFGIAKTGTAVFRAALTPPKAPGGAGTTTLSPTFLDNATATNGAPGGGTRTLKLIDVDSDAIVPYSSPRFGGQFVIDDQTAMALVFAANIDAGTGLTVLPTPYGLDDIRWATTDGGTLYVVDKGPANTGSSALYKVTGPFVAGTALASNDSIPNQVVTVNLRNGKLKPFVQNLQTAKGLVYLDASGAEPSLPVGPQSSVAAMTTAAPASQTQTPSGKPKTTGVVTASTDADTPSTILAIVAILLALGLGGYGIRRTRSARS